MTWKIIADSGCDFREMANLAKDTQIESERMEKDIHANGSQKQAGIAVLK